MNRILSLADSRCSGCFACYNICPSNAIEMIFSAEGFYVPKVDENKCTDCGLCSKVCPVLNTQFEDRFLRPKTYVAWSLDEKTRLNSSSGGIYPEIAKLILEQNGVVFAVGWNNEWLPEHREVTSLEEIAQTIGSKYVQSKVGLSYRKVAENSKTNKKILFVGTPCQVAGLRNFLRMKKIENKVLLVDLVCFGIPSPLIFKKYIKETFRNSKISSISFRCKKTGWAKFSIFIQTEDRVYSKVHYSDPFFWGFSKKLYLNKICYCCPFSKIPRQGDITLGDFWGVPEKYKDERGVSVVILNSENGEKAFRQLIKMKRIFCEEVSLETATKLNPRIVSGFWYLPKNREKILREFQSKSWKYIVQKYIKPPVGFRFFIFFILSVAKIILRRIFKS